MKLRKHQQDLKDLLRNTSSRNLPLSILCNVVPGGGKSALPALLSERFPEHQIAWFVPRLALRRQGALGLQKDFNIRIREAEASDVQPSRDSKGFVATHAALCSQPELFRSELKRRPHLLVVDEVHHAKREQNDHVNKLYAAIEKLPFDVRLLMTGTLETNDSTFIYGVPYQQEGRAFRPDLFAFEGRVIQYSRADALSEKAIVPMEFHRHDGPVAWQSGEELKQVRLSDADWENESQAILTALQTQLADDLLHSCVEHWKKHGDQLLVLALNQHEARRLKRNLRQKNINAEVAISDKRDSCLSIERFREKKVECLVTVAMAYEGLDVPSVTHLAVLTGYRSVPWLLQAFARAWRANGSKDRCWAFVPDDPKMNRTIQAIRDEQEAIVRHIEPFGDGGGGQPQLILPISGSVAEIRTDMLDAGLVQDEATAKAIQALENLGLPLDHPLKEQIEQGLRAHQAEKQRVLSSSKMTPKEEELALRNNIAKYCRNADARRSKKLRHVETQFGWHQAKLMARTGKSIEDMGVKELQDAQIICARIVEEQP